MTSWAAPCDIVRQLVTYVVRDEVHWTAEVEEAIESAVWGLDILDITGAMENHGKCGPVGKAIWPETQGPFWLL